MEKEEEFKFERVDAPSSFTVTKGETSYGMPVRVYNMATNATVKIYDLDGDDDGPPFVPHGPITGLMEVDNASILADMLRLNQELLGIVIDPPKDAHGDKILVPKSAVDKCLEAINNAQKGGFIDLATFSPEKK